MRKLKALKWHFEGLGSVLKVSCVKIGHLKGLCTAKMLVKKVFNYCHPYKFYVLNKCKCFGTLNTIVLHLYLTPEEYAACLQSLKVTQHQKS